MFSHYGRVRAAQSVKWRRCGLALFVVYSLCAGATELVAFANESPSMEDDLKPDVIPIVLSAYPARVTALGQQHDGSIIAAVGLLDVCREYLFCEFHRSATV